MRAGSAAASAGRHVGGAVLEGLLLAALIAALLLALSPIYAPARSISAGHVSAAARGTSWITLNQATSAASVQPSLGSDVSFATGYPANVKNPRIEVLCYQGSDLVYGEAGSVDHTFLLGGGGSIWLSKGGAAACTANLFYFGFHAGHQTYNWLASTSFSAGA
jgi:hypothetical protein